MTWTRLACMACALLVVLQAPRSSALRSVREKQVKLEDIERDNLQSELLKQRPESHPAYHQHQHQHQLHQQQEQQQEPEQTYHPQHYHPQQHQHLQQQHQHLQQQHYRFEQPAAAPQQLQHHHLPGQHQHLQHQQQQLLYQAAASVAPAAPIVPTHVMYLLMPNGNVAAFQLAPHPNHIQAYYTPSGKAHLQQHMPLGTLFHQQASIPMAYLQPQLQQSHQLQSHQLQSHQLQQQLQQQAHQQVQYVPAALPAAQSGQRYHPTVTHQPTLSFNSPQAHQLHAQHFRELSGEPSVGHAAGPEVSTYSQTAEQSQPQPIQQSQKSLFGSGVKATASPPLKGSFSTQTGQSYANFRQYG